MALMNSQQKMQLTALIQMEPGLRTTQLADKASVDFDVMEVALGDLILAGTIAAHTVIAPNGRNATAFTLTGVALPDPKLAAFALKPLAVKRGATGLGMTNVAKAISFIEGKGGSATGAELHAMLGLKPTDYPSTYLKQGISDGLLKKDGSVWTLGDGKPAAPPIPPAAPTKPVPPAKPAVFIERIKAPPAVVLPEPAVTVKAPAVTIDPPKTAPEPEFPLHIPRFHKDWKIASEGDHYMPIVVPATATPGPTAFALSSDGELHIWRDGHPPVVLTTAEMCAMTDYLDNFLVKPFRRKA